MIGAVLIGSNISTATSSATILSTSCSTSSTFSFFLLCSSNAVMMAFCNSFDRKFSYWSLIAWILSQIAKISPGALGRKTYIFSIINEYASQPTALPSMKTQGVGLRSPKCPSREPCRTARYGAKVMNKPKHTPRAGTICCRSISWKDDILSIEYSSSMSCSGYNIPICTCGQKNSFLSRRHVACPSATSTSQVLWGPAIFESQMRDISSLLLFLYFRGRGITIKQRCW